MDHYNTLYLYWNFSGSIDIAISISKLMGWNLPENFNNPLFATNIQDFWRKWHISLTNSLREIIFLPIVNKFKYGKGDIRRLCISILGIYVVFVLSALWHDFTINYLMWGLWHATGMSIYLVLKNLNILGRYSGYLYRFISNVITIIFVSIGWLFFNYSSIFIVDKIINYEKFSVKEIILESPYNKTIMVNYPSFEGYVDVYWEQGKNGIMNLYASKRDGKYNFVHLHGNSDNRGQRILSNGTYKVKLNFYNKKQSYLYSFSREIEIK